MKDMVPVAGPVGRGGCLPFLICSPWKVGIDAFGIPSPGSWLDRMVVVHFNLDYSYPNMKNSDKMPHQSVCSVSATDHLSLDNGLTNFIGVTSTGLIYGMRAI